MRENIQLSAELYERIKSKYSTERPGISITAIKSGNIIYNLQLGLANLEHRIPVQTNTVFNLASITKQFTAMGIMMLVEGGALEYNKQITDILPELNNYKGVTIRHLLNNSSGIENYYRILDRLGKSAINITNYDVYNLLAKQNLLFKPGSKFDYSNSNYVLLAMIIEKISGLSYWQYMHEKIFKRLEMTDTIVFNEKQLVVNNRAYGYRVEDRNVYCYYADALTVGDGGIFSTIEDLFKWDQALYTDKLVSRRSMELAFTNGVENSEEHYGFGWSIDEINRKVWHSGLDAGFRSLIARYIDAEFTVIILSNSTECSWEERSTIVGELYSLCNKY